MKTNLKIIIFISFFPFLGCSVLKMDRLPKNVPKGYVEFNRINPQKSWDVNATKTFIYELKEGKEVFIGELGKGSRKINLRIACTPGNHTFIIHYSLPGITMGKIKDDKVVVSIKENYIVLVNVIMTAKSDLAKKVAEKTYVREIDFNSDIHVEE